MKNTSLIQKCELCKKELGFNDRTIRHEKKWYHAECYRSTTQEKTVIENTYSKKEPVVRAIIVKAVEKITKATVVKTISKQSSKVVVPEKKSETISRCGHCKKELEFHDRTVRHGKKWYHAECYKSTIEVKPLEKEQVVKDTIVELIPKSPVEKVVELETKPERTMKTKELEIEKKRVVDLEEQVVLPKVKLDPVLILISCGIFFFLFWTPFTLLAGFSVGAMMLGGFLVIYQVLDARRWSKSKFRTGKHKPGIFSLLLLVLPFVFGGVLGYEGYTLWESGYRAIILWGLTITFWSVMLMVPLALYSKNKEEQTPRPLQYPMISVIIPAYNEEKVIAKTIESVMEIDYPKKEIIVVDDGSKDKTLQIANEYKRDKVKVLHKENGGKASALNYAMAFANGEIIAVLDADTIAGKNSLKEIARIFGDDENVGAVAGNIKVRNKVNWLTWCQALEYVAGLQIARRAFDLFGAITVVPGALGSFRKSVLQEGGGYDKETLVEDVDTTIKVLKSGMVVRGTTKSIAYTEAPESLRDFYNQRKRWFRGNLQVLVKHRNALTNPRFGFLQKLAFPYMVLGMIILPITGFIMIASAIIAVIQGDYVFVLGSFAFFAGLQYLLVALAVRIDGDDPKLIFFSVFFIIGFKQILDFILIRQLLEQIFGRKARWTRTKRVGFDER
ncbi:MAG: putative Hyaluronan synthase [Nitrosopumilales archaeon]|nr:MAG: putative Hyaluronan synthase [Nitrosopumilales archaeon]